jgi:hypothetical protein
MKEETDALAENDTWEVVDCPKNVVTDNRQVLRTQLNAYGSTKRLCAQLVTNGHVQKAGIAYNETFSPMAR